eukprot:1628166-Alexandrium_andersonii.AAC.1
MGEFNLGAPEMMAALDLSVPKPLARPPAQDALLAAPAPFLEPKPAENLRAEAPAPSDLPMMLVDCARAFSEIAAPAEGLGAP